METMGYDRLWLRYDMEPDKKNGAVFEIDGFDKDNRIIKNAVKELKAGVADRSFAVMFKRDKTIVPEGYSVEAGNNKVCIISSDEKGILYGAFAVIRQLACGADIKDLKEHKNPSNPLRMMNHWDNMDGGIERGYSGRSFYFKDNEILLNDRTVFFARLLASTARHWSCCKHPSQLPLLHP